MDLHLPSNEPNSIQDSRYSTSVSRDDGELLMALHIPQKRLRDSDSPPQTSRKRPHTTNTPDQPSYQDAGSLNLQHGSPSILTDPTQAQRHGIFHRLLEHPELLHEVSKHIEINQLVSLYSISRTFQNIVNKRFTSLVLAVATTQALESSTIFLYKCYKSLCTIDPATRMNEEVQSKIRNVPSFRWARFVLYREHVVEDIIHLLAIEGHHLPPGSSASVKKVWFLMDIGDNARRIGVVRNRSIWSNQDLFYATMLFVKLDMRFNDPVQGNGSPDLRRMLLAQRSLSTLWRVLRREELTSNLELAMMYLQWKYTPQDQVLQGQDTIGVPGSKLGKLQYEGWGKGENILLRPDEIIMRESIRRKLGFQRKYLDMILYGYIDKDFNDIPAAGLKEGDGTFLAEGRKGELSNLDDPASHNGDGGTSKGKERRR
ncbi:hypothetical protein MMC25_004399 [Agyrium rufum]|nr:hypothetical protein [Agyrium rufum]